MSRDTSFKPLIRQRRYDDLAEVVDFSKIYKGIKHRSWLVVLFALAGLLSLGYFAYNLSQTYTASAYLIYQRETPEGLPGGFPVNRFSKSSALELVTLPSHVQAVKTILDLDTDTNDLRKMIDVSSPKPDSNMIQIKVSSKKSSFAVELANTLASVALKNSIEFQKRQLREARSYYQKQVEAFRKRAADKEEEIANFRNESKDFEFEPDGTIRVKSLALIEERLKSVEDEYKTLLVQYENIRREGGKIPDRVVQYSTSENPLKKRLEYTEVALIEARTRYAPANPRVKSLEAEVEELQRLLEETSSNETNTTAQGYQHYEPNPIKEKLEVEQLSMRGRLRSAQKLMEGLQEEYKNSEKALESLPEKQLTFALYLADRDSYRQAQRESENHLKFIDALLNTNKGVLEIYSFASNAYQDRSFIFYIMPIAGLLFGVFCGIMIALFFELSDQKIRTSSQVSLYYNLKSLVQIPEQKRLSANNIEKKLNPYIRLLEAAISMTVGEKQAFTLAVTGSEKGEGKSTITSLLANLYQKQGKKVLIIDLDFQTNPWIQTHKARPLEDFLEGKAESLETISNEGIHNIKASGRSGLFDKQAYEKIKTLISEIKQYYDVVLIETPPLVEEEMGGRVCSWVDHTLFVIGSSQTKQKSINSALRNLEFYQVEPIGVVLNRALKYYLNALEIKRS